MLNGFVMQWMAVSFVLLGAVLLAINVSWMRRFNRLLKSEATSFPSRHYRPRALVFLSLRGADPFLERTLAQLAGQTYQNFELRIVIDHEDDPAWEVVDQFLQRENRPPTRVRILRQRLQTCSLKVSALLQELSDLGPEYDAIVQIDADAVPYANWLHDMLAPLENPKVGAVSGLRWFTPDTNNWGTLYRQIWGSAAMVQMYACRMAWGGSMALSREFLDQSDLFARWSHALSDDLSINGALQTVDMELRYVPAVLTNHEQTNVPGFLEFVRRQVFMARWHHPQWPTVAGNAALTIVVLWLALGSIALTITAGAWWWTAGVALVMLGYCVGFGQTMRWTERNIRRRLVEQGEAAKPLDFWYRFAMFATAPLFLVSFLSALMTRRIQWRGVSYEVNSKGNARLIQDHQQRRVRDLRPRARSYAQ